MGCAFYLNQTIYTLMQNRFCHFVTKLTEISHWDGLNVKKMTENCIGTKYDIRLL